MNYVIIPRYCTNLYRKQHEEAKTDEYHCPYVHTLICDEQLVNLGDEHENVIFWQDELR